MVQMHPIQQYMGKIGLLPAEAVAVLLQLSVAGIGIAIPEPTCLLVPNIYDGKKSCRDLRQRAGGLRVSCWEMLKGCLLLRRDRRLGKPTGLAI